jgi:hypothetical protein
MIMAVSVCVGDYYNGSGGWHDMLGVGVPGCGEEEVAMRLVQLGIR